MGIIMNRLANERSPYLRHAAHQKIDWYPWGDEAFERASRENKPVFLSSGGVWCHWCHVMAKECFEDDEVALFLNALYVCVKLDRDERPDIDQRYQQAVAAMGGGSGWPLSVFLTPDRRAFYGGTYFPLDDRHGRPGFKKVLLAVNEFYGRQRDDAEQYADRIMAAIEPEPLEPSDLTPGVVAQAEHALLAYNDSVNGGFGTAPKFPMPGALSFLIRRAAATKSPEIAAAVRRTLDAMAAGGFHDQLAGGFHRYSVDEAWYVPHFEKMADDNAWLLRNYIEAYAVFGDERYRRVAEGIIRFTREVLADPEGGFFASQDADVTPDDEGGYFIWTDDDLRRVLSNEEYRVLSLRYLHERGRLPHDPDKRVLCAAKGPGAIAAETGLTEAAVRTVIGRGSAKLLAERHSRTAPFVDRTIYTSINGMYIASFFAAFRVLENPELRDFALRSLDRLLKERIIAGEVMHAEGIPALLDDQVHLVEALTAAYEATGDRRFLERAQGLMDDCIERFGDGEGGFFDTATQVLGTRIRRIEDTPHPAANPVAVIELIRLHHLTGREQYRDAAGKALALFSASALAIGVHGGTCDLAVDAWFNTLDLTVESPPESDLARATRKVCGRAIALSYGPDRGRVVACQNGTCFEPARDAAEILRLQLML
jgi:uncharacterized protein YyaL (SSP411 family)